MFTGPQLEVSSDRLVKPGIKPETPGLQGAWFIHYTTASLCLSFSSYALLCDHSSFAKILKRKRKLVALLLLSYRCIVTINVLWLFLAVP